MGLLIHVMWGEFAALVVVRTCMDLLIFALFALRGVYALLIWGMHGHAHFDCVGCVRCAYGVYVGLFVYTVWGAYGYARRSV